MLHRIHLLTFHRVHRLLAMLTAPLSAKHFHPHQHFCSQPLPFQTLLPTCLISHSICHASQLRPTTKRSPALHMMELIPATVWLSTACGKMHRSLGGPGLQSTQSPRDRPASKHTTSPPLPTPLRRL